MHLVNKINFNKIQRCEYSSIYYKLKFNIYEIYKSNQING